MVPSFYLGVLSGRARSRVPVPAGCSKKIVSMLGEIIDPGGQCFQVTWESVPLRKADNHMILFHLDSSNRCYEPKSAIEHARALNAHIAAAPYRKLLSSRSILEACVGQQPATAAAPKSLVWEEQCNGKPFR